MCTLQGPSARPHSPHCLSPKQDLILSVCLSVWELLEV